MSRKIPAIRASLMLGVAAAALCASPTFAQTLAGKATSAEEGAMEGVVVSAKRAGSTITVSVVTDAKGEFHFPAGRLDPGSYAVTIRAIGYDLKAPAKVDVAAAAPAQIDLALVKTKRLHAQLSNAEWLMSMPGTEQQKSSLIGCGECHTLQRPLFSSYEADDMAKVVQRMSTHTTNAAPSHPFFNQDANEQQAKPPTKQQADLGAYIASVNLSSGDKWGFDFKTLPRPKGKATQVIFTSYALPRADAAPHDTGRDKEGNIWYSDFQSPIFGKLDPKTGKVTEYQIPTQKPVDKGFPTGALQLAFDKDDNVYIGTMGQAQVVRFNPKTEKMDTWPAPDWQTGDARVTMIDPRFATDTGEIWVNEAGLPPGNTAFKFNIKANEWSRVTVPQGEPPAYAYGIAADERNNVYGMGMANDNIWETDAKTLKTSYIPLPTRGAGGRRGHFDSQNRLWFAQFYGNSIAMFDPATKKVTAWQVPTKFMNPYDAQFDDKNYVWSGGMSADLIERMNTTTGEFVEYTMPRETNIRHVDVQKDGTLSSLWVEDQHNGKIIHVEPLSE